MDASAPGEGTVCPACGKPVDPLRAGQVAILAGRFRYYCDRACKASHLEQVAASVVGDDVATAEPPSVVERLAPPAFPEPSRRPPESAPGELDSDPDAEREEDRVDDADDPDLDPDPDREGEGDLDLPADGPTGVATSSAPPPSAAPTPPAHVTAPSASPPAEILAIGGLVAGALAALVSVAGFGELRLPLASVAALVALTRALRGARDPADATHLVTAIPLAGLMLAAFAMVLSGEPRAGALASLLGVSAAAVLFTGLLVARARRGVEASRVDIARALDVSVRVVRGDAESELAAALVKPGERLVVGAGEVVGADGIVTGGEAQVVPWIASSIEVTKREGDAVAAGARVISGALRLNVTWSGPDRAWAKLALSPTLRVDVTAPLARLARLGVERGSALAAALAGAASYANGGGLAEIVATACAAALALGAVGVAAMVGLTHAEGHAQALAHGIVYKDAAGFDRAGRTDVAVVCSRGTVLMGEPEIVAFESLGAIGEGRLASLAAGAETSSTDPFAAAILRGARARGETPENVRNAAAHAGLGVTALTASGERLVVGSRALLLQEKISVAVADARVSELEAQGRSVLLVAVAGKLVGLVALQDGLRPGARAAVQRLLDARIEPVLLSGEARETCETIARALDIDHVRPEVLPADRGAEVRALGEGGHVVAVLGHPLSDDGALGAADVAIAMSSAGGTPGEWTVQLASDDVRDAAFAISLARATRDRARVSLVSGLVPPALALLAVGFGLAPLAVAPLAAALGAVIASRTR